MKNIIKILLILSIIILVGIQFIPTKFNKEVVNKTDDFITMYKVPNKIAPKIKMSCYDCHSNNTIYPWYSKVQPMNMLMSLHIEDGKENLNLSEFGAYSDRRKKSKLKSIFNQIKNDEMPLTTYKLLHWDATFTEKEKKEVLKFFNNLLTAYY
jgi:hypothetical protein